MFAQTKTYIACSPIGERGRRINTPETEWRIPNAHSSPNELLVRAKKEKYVDSSKELFLVERNKSYTRIWVGTLILLSYEILYLEGSLNIILDLRLFQNFFYR
jgi:hypothetical protein